MRNIAAEPMDNLPCPKTNIKRKTSKKQKQKQKKTTKNKKKKQKKTIKK